MDKPELELAKNDKDADKKENEASDLNDESEILDGEKGPAVDPVRLETLNILNDLITLTHARKTAAVQP